MHPIESWLQTFVNSPRFASDLENLIETLEDKDRLKVKLALLDYLVPKVKGIEANQQAEDKEITINYAVPDAAHSKPSAVPEASADEPE